MLINPEIEERTNQIIEAIRDFENEKDDIGLFELIIYKRALKIVELTNPNNKYFYRRFISKLIDVVKNIFYIITSPIWIMPVMAYLKFSKD